jgi:hypothetical protein
VHELRGLSLHDAVDWLIENETRLLASSPTPGPTGARFPLILGPRQRELDALRKLLLETGVADAPRLVDLMLVNLRNRELFTDVDPFGGLDEAQ